MATGLLLVLVATLAAKASLHAAVLAGAIPILWLWNPGLGVAGAVLLAAVMWARVREGRHSPAQVALGMVLGLIGGLLFPLLA
jgi:membrane-associated phospholipid phosphatase